MTDKRRIIDLTATERPPAMRLLTGPLEPGDLT